MTFRNIGSVISIVVFLFLAWMIIFFPQIHSDKQELNGEVVIVWKPNRPRASWMIDVREHKTVREGAIRLSMM